MQQPTVIIRIARHDTKNVERILALQKALFPGDVVIRTTIDGYELVMGDEDRGLYVMDQLDIARNDKAFETFGEWRTRSDDQQELALGQAASAAREAFG